MDASRTVVNGDHNHIDDSRSSTPFDANGNLQISDLTPINAVYGSQSLPTSPQIQTSNISIHVHYDECTLRKRMTRLRDSWIETHLSPRKSSEDSEEQSANQSGDMEQLTTSQTSEATQTSHTSVTEFQEAPSMNTDNNSLLMNSKSTNNLEQYSNSKANLLNPISEQYQNLVTSLQREVEITQHIVTDLNATKTMKRRKLIYDELTMRRRSQRARASIGSYVPTPPEASQWGSVFDNIISSYKNNDPVVEQECLQKGTPRSVSDYFKSPDNPPLRFEDDPPVSHEATTPTYQSTERTTPINQPIAWTAPINQSIEGVTHYDEPDNRIQLEPMYDNSLKSSNSTHKSCLPKNICIVRQCNSGSFQESGNSATSSLSTPPRKGCVTFRSPQGRSTKQNGKENSDDLRNLLKGMSIRRHDLASFRIPEPPIRRTESNNDVWVEQNKEENEKLTSTITLSPKPTPWEKIKKVFTRS